MQWRCAKRMAVCRWWLSRSCRVAVRVALPTLAVSERGRARKPHCISTSEVPRRNTMTVGIHVVQWTISADMQLRSCTSTYSIINKRVQYTWHDGSSFMHLLVSCVRTT